MKIVFMDESGYSMNWVENIDEQPFFVLGAVALDVERYPEACKQLQAAVGDIDELELDCPLGQGKEIKAKEISAGKGWWKEYTAQRNQLREMMLSFPELCGATFFLSVIDKKKHHERYAFPDPPHEIAFQYMFERLQWFFKDYEDSGICVYDQTKFLDDVMHKTSAELVRDGSLVQYQSEYYGNVSKRFVIDRLCEFCLGRSENSIGLQVADYLAHFGYQYNKAGKPKKCGWWDTIERNLYRKNGELIGYGLKVFP